LKRKINFPARGVRKPFAKTIGKKSENPAKKLKNGKPGGSKGKAKTDGEYRFYRKGQKGHREKKGEGGRDGQSQESAGMRSLAWKEPPFGLPGGAERGLRDASRGGF